jgi:hypothetical protein
VQKDIGDKFQAMEFLERGRAIMEQMARLSTDNAGWQRDLAKFDREIAALDTSEE